MRVRKPGNSTVFKFLPFDDNAINVEEGTLNEKYQEYIKTGNLTLLNVDKSKSPSYYWFRPLNGHLWQKVKSLLALENSEDEDVVEVTVKSVHEEVLRYCLIGVDYHPEVVGVRDNGELDVVEWSWKVGQKEPVGIKDALLKEEAITHAMFQFIIAISILTEDEKKA